MKKNTFLFIGILSLSALVLWALYAEPPESILLPLTTSEEVRTFSSGIPILVLYDQTDANVYARYITEILKAEGLFGFEAYDIHSLPQLDLKPYSLVVTATSSRTLETERRLLISYVEAGGRLLMIAPPAAFDTLLGIERLPGVIDQGYLWIDTNRVSGRGFSVTPLQFFGPANLVRGTSTSVLSSLSSSRSSVRSPAAGVVSHGFGKAAFFSYDIGRSIVFTRQGKPTGGRDANEDGVLKVSDLYYESFDNAQREIPQADEHQRFFSHVLTSLVDQPMLIPRVWYFPYAAPSIALLTGDHHGQNWNNEIERIANYARDRGGSITCFIYSDMIDTSLVTYLVSQGHTVAPHLYYPRKSNRIMRLRQWIANGFSSTYFFRPRLADLHAEIEYGISEFKKLSVGPATLTRLHYLIWPGWTETPQLLSQAGFAMDFSVTGIDPRAAVPPNASEGWNAPTGYGYINGSGLPMQYINDQGLYIPLFSQLTLFEDDVTIREMLAIPSNDSVTTAELILVTRRFIEASLTKYPTALVWNFHPEHITQRWPPEGPTTWAWITSTIDYLASKEIPMISGSDWLSFVNARSTIQMGAIVFDPVTQEGGFSIVSREDIRGVTIRLPLSEKIKSPRSLIIHHTTGSLSMPIMVVRFGARRYLELVCDIQANTPLTVSYRL